MFYMSLYDKCHVNVLCSSLHIFFGSYSTDFHSSLSYFLFWIGIKMFLNCVRMKKIDLTVLINDFYEGRGGSIWLTICTFTLRGSSTTFLYNKFDPPYKIIFLLYAPSGEKSENLNNIYAYFDLQILVCYVGLKISH